MYAIVQWVREWHQNNKSPILTVPAKVVAKRENVIYQQHNVGDVSKTYCFYTTTNSEYFATFEKESGERMEFLLGGSEYGMVAEGDVGN